LEKNYKYQKELILNLNDQNQKLNEQHAALAELNDTKDRYYSILAHDLRNPMHTILGLSEVVNENLKAGNSEEAALHISTLIGTAQNTYQLLDNLLLWSYSQSGKIKLQSEPFDFKLIIEDSISIFENNIQSKKIKVEFDSNEIHEINADKNMLGTVVRNLLSNAIKFSHRGGKIKISCECKKNQHLFKIKDSGIGIPEDSIQTIFDITNTLSTKGTNNEKGTGYGLAICREFIEKHNGKIWVECKYGRSTTFFFTIPNTAKPLKNYAVD